MSAASARAVPPSQEPRRAPRVLLAAVLGLVACGPAAELPAEEAAPGKAEQPQPPSYFAPPSVAELIGGSAPLAVRSCELSWQGARAAFQDGLWCGSSLVAAAPAGSATDDVLPDALHLCVGGETYAREPCAASCRAGADTPGRRRDGSATALKHDRCTAEEPMIVIGLRQQRLRFCSGATVLEHGVSTGDAAHPTWQPIVPAAGAAEEHRRFSIGTKYLVRQMVSPYAGDYYNARLPWSMNLRTPAGHVTYEYLHASGACGYCGQYSPAGTGRSHGCVNQPASAARQLFMLAPGSTPVQLLQDLPASGCIACFSRTRGHEVEQGACVQTVGGAWFRCSVGQWLRNDDRARCGPLYPLPPAERAR